MISTIPRHLSSLAVALGLLLTAFSCLLSADDETTSHHDDLESVWNTTADSVREMVLQTSELPGGESVRKLADEPVLLWVERCYFGSENYYSAEEVRYGVVRLLIANRTDEEIQIRRSEIHLHAAGKTYRTGETGGKLKGVPLQIDWDAENNSRNQAILQTPRVQKIAPGKAVGIWCVFAPLERVPAFPEYSLTVKPESRAEVSLDLTSQQIARLGLVTEQLGPHRALTVLTIHGQLNRANAPYLADAINKIVDKKGLRVLVNWASGAKPSDELLLNWLMNAGSHSGESNPERAQLPPLPVLRALALADVAPGNEDIEPWDIPGKVLFENSFDAAEFLLQEIYERIDPQIALQEIRTGHPWSKSAALKFASDRLPATALSLLTDLATRQGSVDQKGAIFALGNQNSPQAEEVLKQLLHSPDPATAEAAFAAMLRIPTPSRRVEVMRVLDESLKTLPLENVYPLLAEYYHPEWNSYLVKGVFASSPKIRVTALQSLARTGHAQLSEFCEKSLEDPEPEVREEAFRILVDSNDREAEQAARAYALRQLNEGNFDSEILDYLSRIRETQAAPALLKEIKRQGAVREPLIEVLAIIGSSEDLQSVLEGIDQYSDEEALFALTLIPQVSTELQIKTIRKLIPSQSSVVRESVIEHLKEIGSDQALVLMSELLKDPLYLTHQDRICIALGEIGNQAAIHRLKQFQQDSAAANHLPGLQAADQALKSWRRRLPGFNYAEAGAIHESTEDHAEAIKAYSMAILINPDLADAYSGRGNVYLRTNEFKKAGEDFRQAYKLDEFDGQAITGVAIVSAIEGETDAAIELIRSRAARFPNDRFFSYNTACVYSRCVETLKKQEQSPERDEKILEYQKLSIEKLKESQLNGFQDLAWMQRDPDLAAIRELPEFKKMLAGE